MKKILSLLALVLMSCMGAWAEDNLAVSTDVNSPEYVYTMRPRNTSTYYLTAGLHSGTTGGSFAFFAAEGEKNYYVYSVKDKQWLTYTDASNGKDKVTLSSTQSSYFHIEYVTSTGNADGDKTGYTLKASNANVYMNFWQGPDTNEYLTTGTVGFWQDGLSDAGSVWVLDVYTPCWKKPQFGGTVWTWNTTTGKFDATNQTSTETPQRANNKGPVYVFDGVETVNRTSQVNTSDNGGIRVLGEEDNVTVHMGTWAGAIEVEQFAVATVSYGHLKGTEPTSSATVWVNGELTFNGTTFTMDDGNSQRWYIGESGKVNTNFNKVSGVNANRTWSIEAVVADKAPIDGYISVRRTITKKIMTWNADLSSSIASIKVFFKDAKGEYTELENAVTYDNTGITVSYEGVDYLPFVPGNVYYLGVRLNNQKKPAYYVTCNGTNAPTRSMSSPSLAEENLWVFEPVTGASDQFYLKNFKYGYVSTNNGSITIFQGTNKTPMKLGVYTGTNHQNGNADFYFTDATTVTQVFGDHNTTNSTNYLGYWNNGKTDNEGSAFRVAEVDFTGMPILREHHVTNGFTTNLYDADKVAAASNNPTEDNVRSAFESSRETVVPALTISPDKYYRIVDYLGRYANAAPNANAEGVMQDSNRGVADNAGKTDVTSLWQFTNDNHIIHVNSGLHLGQLTSGSQVTLTLDGANYGGTYSATEVAGKHYLQHIKNGSNYLNTNHQILQVHGWNADGDGSRWYIVEAETIPVTVGSAGYTTVNFPVAVTIPAEVKAYKVTAETSTSMTLAEVEGSVPAGTALIIEASANTYNFTIATSGTDAAGNLLLGTTARRTGFGENTFYALAADANAKNGVSFKKNGSVAAIPANKAYLPVSTSSSNKALYFDFGGETLTGIDAVEALPATDALYNINGQRVVAPTRGIYVKANGQKVFIK